MPRFIIATIVALISTATVMATTPTDSPAEKYKALVDEFEEVGGARQFADSFFALADEHPKDRAAVDSLLWIVTNLKNRPDAKRALEVLTARHIDSEQLGPGCPQIARTPTVAAERLLRACIERSPHRSVQAQASYYLALHLQQQAEVSDQLQQQPELAPRIMEYYGKEYGEHLASLDRVKLNSQIEKTYEQLKASFADVAVKNSTMGDLAERALFRIRHLSIGRPAPDIDGEDIDGGRFRLSEYRGKVVMLSFWGHW